MGVERGPSSWSHVIALRTVGVALARSVMMELQNLLTCHGVLHTDMVTSPVSTVLTG